MGVFIDYSPFKQFIISLLRTFKWMTFYQKNQSELSVFTKRFSAWSLQIIYRLLYIFYKEQKYNHIYTSRYSCFLKYNKNGLYPN